MVDFKDIKLPDIKYSNTRENFAKELEARRFNPEQIKEALTIFDDWDNLDNNKGVLNEKEYSLFKKSMKIFEAKHEFVRQFNEEQGARNELPDSYEVVIPSNYKDENGNVNYAQQTIPETVGADHYEYDRETGYTKHYNYGRLVDICDKDGRIIEEFPLTQDEIDKNLAELKPGEKYLYTDKNSHRSSKSTTLKTVAWTRNDDNTLTEEKIQENRSGKVSNYFLCSTKYSTDGKHKIEESIPSKMGGYATTKYDENGNPIQTIHEIINSNYKGVDNTYMLDLYMVMLDNNSSQKLLDSDGNVIVRSENGKFYDNKNRAITALDIQDCIENHKSLPQTIVQNY